MTFPELKEWLKKLVQEQMEGNVSFAEQYKTQPPLPYTTLKLRDTGIPLHPVSIVKDGKVYAYYECEKILEVNRYTAGVSTGAGESRGLEDTSAADLTGLLLYLQSDQGTERMFLANLCILQTAGVRNLTALEGTRYKNRAMLELTVRCVLEYQEGSMEIYAPEAGMHPAQGPAGYFEEVEMEDRYE